MGGFLTKITRYFKKKPEHGGIILGLDGAGKTTLLYQLKLHKEIKTISTIGFNVETLEYPDRTIVLWDLGGIHKIRNLWPAYFARTQLVLFVIDSGDKARLPEVKQILWSLLTHRDLSKAKFLIFANKQDQKHAMSVHELKDALELQTLGREWYIQGCSATLGDGVQDGVRWALTSFAKSS